MTAHEPFYHFAFEAEDPLRQARAEMCACHTILATRRLVDDEVIDAISHLITAICGRLDRLIEMHGEAFEALQKARGA